MSLLRKKNGRAVRFISPARPLAQARIRWVSSAMLGCTQICLQIGIETVRVKQHAAHARVMPRLDVDITVAHHGSLGGLDRVPGQQAAQRVRGGLVGKAVLAGHAVGKQGPQAILLKLLYGAPGRRWV